VREVPQRNGARSSPSSRTAALHRERPGGLTAPLWLNYHSLQLERFFDFVEHCSGGTASTDLQTTVFQIATRLFHYSGTTRRLAARSFKGAIR
jgi:hypothetical protein